MFRRLESTPGLQNILTESSPGIIHRANLVNEKSDQATEIFNRSIQNSPTPSGDGFTAAVISGTPDLEEVNRSTNLTPTIEKTEDEDFIAGDALISGTPDQAEEVNRSPNPIPVTVEEREDDDFVDMETLLKGANTATEIFQDRYPLEFEDAGGISLDRFPVPPRFQQAKDPPIAWAVDETIARWVEVERRPTPISNEEIDDARKTTEKRITLQRAAKNDMIDRIGEERVAYLDQLARTGNPQQIDQWNSRTELENAYLIQMLLKKNIPGRPSTTHNNAVFQLYQLDKLAKQYPSLAEYLSYDVKTGLFPLQAMEKVFGSQITLINITQGDWNNATHGHHEGNKPPNKTDPGDFVINITLNDSERLSLKGMQFDPGLVTSLYDLVTFETHSRDQASPHDPAVKIDPQARKERNLAVIAPKDREEFFKRMAGAGFSVPLFGAPENAHMPRAKLILEPPPKNG